MNFVNDLSSKELDDFRDIKLKKPHLRNLFFIESLKVYLKALDSEVKIIKTITTKDCYKENKNIFSTGQVITTTNELLNSLIQFKSHTKVFAIAEIPSENINFEKDIIFFNNITSPENVGAITRSALAFNFNQIIYDSGSLTPWNRRSVRVSTGNIFKFNTARVRSTLSFFNQCKEKGYEIISMANNPKAIDIKSLSVGGKKVIVLGSEGHGISEEILKISTKVVKIPVNHYVEHLNVGHAAAIAFYQFSK
tara:strand:- start:4557 stop:5309 length:753 start_codon:yes stop_codon:yes gene_type:complete